MRQVICFFAGFILLFTSAVLGQPPTIEEMDDTAIVKPLLLNMMKYFFRNPDSTLYYAERIYEFGNTTDNYPVTNFGLQMMGEAYTFKGDFPKSIKAKLAARSLNRKHNDQWREAYTNTFIGFTYLNLGDYKHALQWLLPARTVLLKAGNDWTYTGFNASNIGFCYTMLDDPDSADYYNNESLRFLNLAAEGQPPSGGLRTLIYERIGNAFEKKGEPNDAIPYYRLLIHYGLQDSVYFGDVITGQIRLAEVYAKMQMDDSALFYSRRATINSQSEKQIIGIQRAASVFASIFRKQEKPDSALHYQTIAMALNDSIYGIQNFSELQLLVLKDQQEQQDLIAEKTALKNTLILSLVAVVAVAFLIIALVLRRNNRVKQNINRQLETQKSNLESTLKELKSTQAQLIQSEKMASLGELTAGIAHEIQNPLNFVNNFSEVSGELLEEARGKRQEAKENSPEVAVLLTDIKENLEKINHHGKRADEIVKGMLQHSQSSKGTKEPTDINVLCDEYFRLAYHGFKAKHPAFHAELKTEFDDTIGEVNVVPQDIGRVLLNLCNNAFYAVSANGRDNRSVVSTNTTGAYQPQVSISTKKKGNQIEISVKDNGDGIPEKIVDKIFQPFFTTKPTGQGTGLGLSLAYDIIKAHGGQIKATSTGGNGSEFSVKLNANT